SKYGPEVTSVILIKTKKKTEGLHATISANISVSERMSESSNGGIGYRMENGLYVFGDFSADESRFKQKRHYSETVSGYDMGSVGNSDTYMTCRNRTRSIMADGGLIYDFGKHSVGVKYSFSRTPFSRFVSNCLTLTDLLQSDEISSTSNMLSQKHQHYLNSFLQFVLPKSINLKVDMDYIHSRSTSTDNADEEQTATEFKNIGKNWSDLLAAKLELEKSIGKVTASAGGDYTYTDHRQDFISHATGDIAQILKPAADYVKQNLYSAFMSFDWKISDRWQVYGGVRYDGTRTKYVRNNIYEKSLSKSYKDLLPDIGVQFRSLVMLSMSYRQKVYRPSYSSLSNNYSYVTPTHWETGNPELMKMKAQSLQLDMSYRKFMLQAEATHYNRKIGISCRYYPEINASVTETVNLPSYNMLQIVAVQRLDVKRWHPTIQGVMVLQDLKFGEPKRSYSTPFYQISFNNRFDLPRTFYAYLSFFVLGGGNIETQFCRTTWQTSLTVSKNLGNWNFNLSANDVFGTWRQKVMTHTNNLIYSYNIKGASQYISLSVRYRFRTAKKTYSGKSVRSDEINRL
ncbi:MAG: outer membrane beta-barrel family protein, partial [Muribaculaceae bacterium]|nr:outer membrane beta-barrel family protein [Muribaculaceae bacterium]